MFLEIMGPIKDFSPFYGQENLCQLLELLKSSGDWSYKRTALASKPNQPQWESSKDAWQTHLISWIIPMPFAKQYVWCIIRKAIVLQW